MSATVGRLAVVLATISLTGCTPVHTAFDGRETDAWLAFDVEIPKDGPKKYWFFGPFVLRAKTLGCHVEGIRNRVYIKYTGIAAYCLDGSIALLDLPGPWLRIGCERPTTRENCEGLLEEISETRMKNFNAFGF